MLHDTRFNPERVCNVSSPVGLQYRKINFDLCTALDLTKLSIVLDKLVEAGMHPNQAKLYKTQADALLQLMCSENNRIHGF
jgi:hypothetical protein